MEKKFGQTQSDKTSEDEAVKFSVCTDRCLFLSAIITHSYVSINSSMGVIQGLHRFVGLALFFFFLEPLHKFKNSGSCAVTSTEFNKEDILRTEKRKRIILVITSPLSAFTLCVVFCWNKSLHAVARTPIHGQAFARVLYTMHDSHLPRTTCLNIILHVGQKCASKCKCLHKSHYHPTPHTRPISGLI